MEIEYISKNWELVKKLPVPSPIRCIHYMDDCRDNYDWIR